MHLQKPTSKLIRALKPGSVLLVSAGDRGRSGQYRQATYVATIASRMQIKLTQRTMVLVDPVTHTSEVALLIRLVD
jgi:hypothetical protein